MRLFVADTGGNYYFHVFYKAEQANFRVLIGDREQLPPPTPPDVSPDTLGTLTMQLHNYHGWIDLKGSGKILGFYFSTVPDIDPLFMQSLSLQDVMEVRDDRRIIVPEDLNL